MRPSNMEIVQTSPVSTVILIRRETKLLVRLAMVRFFMLHKDRAMAQVMVVLQTRSKTAHVFSGRFSGRSGRGKRKRTHSDRLVHFARSDCGCVSAGIENTAVAQTYCR